MGIPEGFNDPATIRADLESAIKTKNEQEREKIIKKIENKATTVEDKKYLRARTKEQVSDRYYVDPLTGYA